MTLVVALVCKDGVVVASDSQQTVSGMPLMRQPKEEPKTKQIGDRLLLAGSGSLGPLQEIEDKISALVKSNTNLCARDLAEEASVIVHSVTKDHYERLKALGSAPIEDMSSIPTGTIIIASYDGSAQVYEIYPDGYKERQSRYCAVGSSQLYAELILKDHYRKDMSCEDGIFLAYYTIRQASEVDTYVGGPIHIYVAKADGIHTLSKEEDMAALEDDFLFRRDVIKGIFAKWQDPEFAPKVLRLLADKEDLAK